VRSERSSATLMFAGDLLLSVNGEFKLVSILIDRSIYAHVVFYIEQHLCSLEMD
jgi:hypothetical protein